MIALVDKYDLNEYKYICDSVKNSVSWPQFVSEAQLLDVKAWLGDCLLNELATQAATSPPSFTPANEALLDGGTYTYNGKTYIFQGLKACIVYYAFARFINRTSYNFTAAGIVVKDSDYSNPVSDKVIQRMETEARLVAEAIKCEIIAYLKRNYTLYECWTQRGCGSSCRDDRPFKLIGD